MHSLSSEFLLIYNINSKEFQGQYVERSQPIVSTKQIKYEFWQQHTRAVKWPTESEFW